MNRHLIITLIFSVILLGKVTTAQTVQWAYKVIDCSSEFKDKDKSLRYRAVQVIGNPNVLPQGGESPCAWSPKRKNKMCREYIHVAFENPMQIKQIAIAESFRCGTVVMVKLIDEQGKQHKVKTFTSPKPGETSRMLNVYLPLTEYKVKEAIVYLKTSLVKGWNHIDAIGISDSDTPIKAKINTIPTDEEIELEILNTNVNSDASDLKPIVSPDGKLLYFVRKNHPENIGQERKDDIWVSELGPEGWGLAYQLPAPLNNNGYNYVNGVSPDGSMLLLGNVYGPNGNKSLGMSVSYKFGDKWEFPTPLKIKNYYNHSSFMEAHVTSDFSAIVMAVWRNETYGSKDLYVSFNLGNDNWSEPKNLGRTINTASSEMAPFLAADGKTLYFASSGYSGYGDYDIYMSHRLDDTWQNWSEPINMGPVINSEAHDAYLSLDVNGEYAFLSRNYADSKTQTDIFKIKLLEETRPEKMQIAEVRLEGLSPEHQALLVYANIDDLNTSGIAYSQTTKDEQQVLHFAANMTGIYNLTIEAPGYKRVEFLMDTGKTSSITLKLEKLD